MDFDIREIMLLLGEKDLIIYQQTKMIEALNNRLEELLNGKDADSEGNRRLVAENQQ